MSQKKIFNLISDTKFLSMGQRVLQDSQMFKNFWFTFKKGNHGITTIKDLDEMELLVKDYDILILHSISNEAKHFLEKTKYEGYIVWKGFGKDYYNFCSPFVDLIDAETKKIYNKITGKRFIFSPLSESYNFKRRLKRFKRIFQKIDLFLPVVQEEIPLLNKGLKDKFFKQTFQWGYASIISQSLEFGQNGNNILLGNSCTFANNHLDAFVYLKDFDFTNRKIIVPLAYGSERNTPLFDRIIEKGQYYFGKSFHPITDFMPSDEYFGLLNSCSTVIMYQKRQQAMGNLNVMFWKGCNIYIRQSNPLFNYYSNLGLKFFDADKPIQKEMKTLNKEEQKINNRIMSSVSSDEFVQSQTDFFYAYLNNCLKEKDLLKND